MLNLSSRLRTKFSKSNSITPLIIVWAKQPKKLPSTTQRKWTGLNTPWSTIKKLLVLLCLATTNTAPRCGTVWWLTVHSTSTVPPLSRNRRWSILFSSDTTTYWEQDGDRLFKLEMTWFHGLAQATISSWQATARRTNLLLQVESSVDFWDLHRGVSRRLINSQSKVGNGAAKIHSHLALPLWIVSTLID